MFSLADNTIVFIFGAFLPAIWPLQRKLFPLLRKIISYCSFVSRSWFSNHFITIHPVRCCCRYSMSCVDAPAELVNSSSSSWRNAHNEERPDDVNWWQPIASEQTTLESQLEFTTQGGTRISRQGAIVLDRKFIRQNIESAVLISWMYHLNAIVNFTTIS